MSSLLKALQRISAGSLHSPSLSALGLTSSEAQLGFAVRGVHQSAISSSHCLPWTPLDKNGLPRTSGRGDDRGICSEARQTAVTLQQEAVKLNKPAFIDVGVPEWSFAGGSPCLKTFPVPLSHSTWRSRGGIIGPAAGFTDARERGGKWVMPGSVRGIAKQVASPHLARPAHLKIFVQSTGIIAEPYQGKEDLGSFFFRWFTREGWARRKKRILDAVKTGYALARLRQKNKGFTRAQFYRDVVDQYSQINTALAQGNRSALRKLVTEKEFTNMKRELKHREDGGWAKVDWAMDFPVESIGTVQARLMALDKENLDNSFIQITVSLRTRQKFAVYDKKGNLVAGDPEEKIQVKDYWVFERQLLEKNNRWLLAGRLSI